MIDVERASEAKKRAEQRMQVKQDNVAFKQAELALKHAINRFNVTQDIF